jgi:hypothetical protein
MKPLQGFACVRQPSSQHDMHATNIHLLTLAAAAAAAAAAEGRLNPGTPAA